MLLTVGRSYVGNDVTHSMLLDRACACSYKNLPKYRSYGVSNTAPWYINLARFINIMFNMFKYIFNCMPINRRTYADSDGHFDSIRQLLGSSNITNPQLREHNLLHLLTTSDTRV